MEGRHALHQFPEYWAAKAIWRYVAPSVLLVGTVGNVLSLLVLTRKPLRGSSTMLYLAVLAVVDLAVLYTGLLRLYLQMAHGYNLRLTSDATCKIHSFLVYFLLDLSVWLIALVTADRCKHVIVPFGGKRGTSLKRSVVLVVGLVVLLALINCHLLWTATLRQVNYWGGGLACDHHTDYDYFMTQVWPKIDLVIFFGLPFTVMLVSNLLIIRTFVRSSNNLRRHSRRVGPGEGSRLEVEGRGASNTFAPNAGPTKRAPSVVKDDDSGRLHSIIDTEPIAERAEASEDDAGDKNKEEDNVEKEENRKDEINGVVKREENGAAVRGKIVNGGEGHRDENGDVNGDVTTAAKRGRPKGSPAGEAQNGGTLNGHVAFRPEDDVLELQTKPRPWWRWRRRAGKVADVGQTRQPSQAVRIGGRLSRNNPENVSGLQEEYPSAFSEANVHEQNCHAERTDDGGGDGGQGGGQGHREGQGRRASQRRRSRLTSESGGGRGTSWVTVTLVVMSAVFLLLTAPVVIYLIGFEVTWSHDLNPRVQAQLTLAWAVTNVLQYSNSAANFFLYCLTGPRFRRELASLFCCRGHR